MGGFPEPYGLAVYFGGCVFPLHTAYIGEYLHFRYLKCLINKDLCYFRAGGIDRGC